MRLYPLVLKVLSENENLTSNHNSVTNLRKMADNNTKVDLVSMNAYTNFGDILSICSQDIERK